MKNVFKFDESVTFERIKRLCDICTLDGSVVSEIRLNYDIRRPYTSTVLTIWTTKKRNRANENG